MLGLVGCFGRSISHFSETSHSISQFLNKSCLTHKQWKEQIKWQQIHQAALDQLLQCLVTLPIFVYPDFSKLFTIHTGVSRIGLGCAMFQVQDEILRAIRLESPTHNGADKV